MGFWAYMLHCADRSFYVGHTDDLDIRIATHMSGEFGGYASTRRPVTLVWCDEFPSRYEALSAERQIKGWSRAKKLALIRGDWTLISRLAKNREERDKERASTSSARTEEGPVPPPIRSFRRATSTPSVRAEPVEAVIPPDKPSPDGTETSYPAPATPTRSG